MRNTTAIILFLFCSVIFADQTYYICDSTGNSSNNCGSQAEACKTLSDAISKISDLSTSVIINACGADYTGSGNINLILPEVPITIQKNTEDSSEIPVIFNGNGFPIIFNPKSSFTLNNITLQTGVYGIQYNPNQPQELNLNSVTIDSVVRGIYIDNKEGSFQIQDSTINHCENGIYVATVKEINIQSTIFTNIRETPINVQSFDIETISIENITVESTEAVTISVGVNTQGIINDSTFNVQENSMLDLSGGNWVINQAKFQNSENCTTAIYFQGQASQLHLQNIDISTCSTGIKFFSSANLIIEGGNIKTSQTCLEITKINELQISSNVLFENCIENTIFLQYDVVPIQIEIDNIHFSNTGTLEFSQASESISTISNCIFENIHPHVIFINGGTWNFDNINATGNQNYSHQLNGGLFYLSSSESSYASFFIDNSYFSYGFTSAFGGLIYMEEADLFIRDSSFDHSSASGGGAIYLYNFFNFTCISCSFNDNHASYYGGAIELESDHALALVADSHFNNNQAISGSSIACCTTSESLNDDECTVLLFYPNSNSNSFENQNTSDENGDVVSCVVYLQNNDAPPNNNESTTSSQSPNSSVYWIILTCMFVFVTILSILVVLYFVLTKKKTHGDYERLDNTIQDFD